MAVAKQIIDGLHDSKGRRGYFSYRIGSSFDDAATHYNSTTKTWELDISSFGSGYLYPYTFLLNTTDIPDFSNATYDTMVSWMYTGWQRYQDTLQTTWPDLTPFHNGGSKILHYHGEQDASIPTASSVYWHDNVRKIMYPGMSYNESTAALNEWYRLYLVPGAGHCGTNSYESNGPYPQTNLAVMINWVEKGIVPTTLNATILSGDDVGQNQQICAFPLRPHWTNNGTKMECQMIDQASLGTWTYDLNAFKLPVY